MTHVFVYGSLQLTEVMVSVTGRGFKSKTARLEHYARYRLRGKSFPGIRPQECAVVDGLVYLDLDMPALAQLDAFEDAFYRRETVTVSLLDGSECPADTYVIKEDSYGLLLPKAWSLKAFKRDHLTSFLLNHE